MADEVYALDLDTDLLWHLAKPESVAVLVAEKVRDEIIEDEEVARVFNWQLAHYREHGKPASASVLEDEFVDIAIDEPEATIDDLVSRLRRRYLNNNGREVLLGLKETYKKEPGELAAAMARESRRLLDLTAKHGEEFGTGDGPRALALYEERTKRGRGPSFGFKEVDEHFWGQEGLTYTLAMPKNYKSWFAICAVLENIKQGKCAHLYSLELPADETDMRLRCLAADVPYWKYLRGVFAFDELRRLKDMSEFLDQHGVYSIVKPPPGQRDIETMFHRAVDRGADLVVVDQLQYVEVDRGPRGNVPLGEGDTNWYWQALNKARDLSDHVPIQFIHQFNRTAMFSEEMPTVQQAKASAAVEETATTAFGLWANRDMRASNIIELGTIASRNYGLPSWQVDIELSRGCDFTVAGRSDEEDDE